MESLSLQIKTIEKQVINISRNVPHDVVYETADTILRSGGILHIVDRGEIAESEFLQKDFFKAHQDQARFTSLEVKSLDWIEYKEAESQKAIEMVVATPISGRNPKLDKLALQSVFSLKP